MEANRQLKNFLLRLAEGLELVYQLNLKHSVRTDNPSLSCLVIESDRNHEAFASSRPSSTQALPQ